MTFGISATTATLIGAGATLGGAYLSSQSSKSAANTQANAAGEASQQASLNAMASIESAQGVLNQQLATADAASKPQIQAQLDSLNQQLAVAKQAHDDQLRIAGETRDAQLGIAGETRDKQLALSRETLDRQMAQAGMVWDAQKQAYTPYQEAGLAGQKQLLNYLGIGADTGSAGYGKYATAEFTPEMFRQGVDPGYAFRLDQGLLGLDRQAAARGGLISGNALKAASGFAGEQASQEYNNAYNRYQTSRQNTLAPYQALQGVGFNAATGLANSAGQYGTNTLNSLSQYGNNSANALGQYGTQAIGAYGGYGGAAGNATGAYGNAAGSAYGSTGNNMTNIYGSLGGQQYSAYGNYGNQVTGALTGYGNAQQANTTGAGNALAAGQVGQANAINSGISGVTNQYYQNQMLGLLKDRNNAANTFTPNGGGSIGTYSRIQDPNQ